MSTALLAMSRRLEVRDVLRTIVVSARELLDAEYAALGVPDDHGGFAQFVVDGISPEQWRRIGPLPRQHGILAAMLHEGGPERLADVRKDPRFEGWPAAHPEMSDFLGMPVRDGEETLGALFLANKRGGSQDGRQGFTDEDQELLSSSPSTRPSRSPTPISTSAAASSPSPRSAPGSPTSCTTPSARSSSRSASPPRPPPPSSTATRPAPRTSSSRWPPWPRRPPTNCAPP